MMDSDSMTKILAEGGMLLEDDKATKQMQHSITKFASLLICPLCNKIFDRPATLSACGHTFCMDCIDRYSANNCNCPVEGCGMPISIVGGNGGSFRKLNLQISQTIESLQLICKSLNQSEENWWLSPPTLQSIKEMKASSMKEQKDELSEILEAEDRVDFPFEGRLSRNDSRENGDDEEMIDLQANEEEQSCLSVDDEKEVLYTVGDMSEDENCNN